MTHIKILKQNGKYQGFQCSGHTGFGVQGQDVLCATISALVGSCHLGLSKVLKEDLDFEMDEKNGFFQLSLKNTNSNEAQLLMTTFVESVKELAKNYQKFIKLKIGG